MRIRDVSKGDAAEIAAIYGHHVLNGTASYDMEPPSVVDTAAKIERIARKGWPFLVVEEEGRVVGYAYATQFRDRPAYAFTCENSIYVHPAWLGKGVGKALLQELCGRAEQCGFRQIVAVIGGGEKSSMRLHASCGFELVGRLHAVGWKKDRWLDTIYMQKSLSSGSSEPASAWGISSK